MIPNKRLMIMLLMVLLLLLIPIIAMQYTDEVHWTNADFIMAGVLLISSALLCELVMRKIKRTSLKIFSCMLVLIILLLIWAELAVGIFGTRFGGT